MTTVEDIKLYGIAASPGICIGKAYLVDSEGVNVVKKYRVQPEKIGKEVLRFKAAVKKAVDELRDLIEETREDLGSHTVILQTHEVLLKDKMLYGKTIELIENEHINAEWALKKVVAKLKGKFRNLSDAYMRDRSSDVVQVSDRILRNLVGGNHVNIAEIDKRVILVANDLSPAETSQINLERVKGFITNRGARTSHTGIIARTLQLPAVVGVARATRRVANDDLLIVDGINGVVVLNPDDQTIIEYEELKLRFEEHYANIRRESLCEAVTSDGFEVPIMGNIELPEEVVSVRDNGGDGIGLYRTEFQYLNRAQFPTEEELYDKYKDVIELMTPKPVTIRTLDINGDKAIAAVQENDEPNPALGLRGIRYCLNRPEIFQTQLRAILRAAVHGQVRLMFPMIANFDEIVSARKMMDQAAESLAADGIAYNSDVQIGILIEVPSAVVMADLMAEAVDFFSIGTNDLIQYTMAIDRGNRDVAHMYEPLNPAIIRMLHQVTEVAHAKNVKVFMCGEMAGDPEYVPMLMGLGLDELSINPAAIPVVKCMIRSLDREQTRTFAQEALSKHSAREIRELTQAHYGEILSATVLPH